MLCDCVTVGEVVRKVKHSSMRIANPLLALYRGTGYFSLAMTFRTVWGGGRCVEILAFVFFGAKWLDVLGLLFRTDKTI